MSDDSTDTPAPVADEPAAVTTPDPAPVAETVATPPAPPFHYVVVRAGHGHAIGDKITDAAAIEDGELATAGWAVRVSVES